MFHTWIGVSSFVVGSQCSLTKSQLMQEISVQLSTRVWVLMAFIMCKGTISWIGICMEGVLDCTVTAQVEEVGDPCIK